MLLLLQWAYKVAPWSGTKELCTILRRCKHFLSSLEHMFIAQREGLIWKWDRSNGKRRTQAPTRCLIYTLQVSERCSNLYPSKTSFTQSRGKILLCDTGEIKQTWFGFEFGPIIVPSVVHVIPYIHTTRTALARKWTIQTCFPIQYLILSENAVLKKILLCEISLLIQPAAQG
jgi:hypothetical protein